MSIDGPSNVNNQGLIHINTNNLEVISRNNHTKVRSVRLLTTATIKFNGFAIMQFIEGADLILTTSKATNATTLAKLVIKLTRSMNTDSDFTYEELCILRSWLETRMRHCEAERDTRSSKFNADTYIGQKFLLLDLRELLLGEILSEIVNPKSL